MDEIWRDVKDYEGFYQISNLRRVLSLARYIFYKNGRKYYLKEHMMSQHLNAGYYAVSVHKNGIRDELKIHRAIAEAFISNPLNLPEVNHKDGNKLNNEISNLEWCTSRENQLHAYKIKLRIPTFGQEGCNAKLNDIDVYLIKILLKYLTRKLISKMFNVSISTIDRISSGRTWLHITI